MPSEGGGAVAHESKVMEGSMMNKIFARSCCAGLILAIASLPALAIQRNVMPGELTDKDRAAIRELDRVFVDGWLKDDQDAVMSVFAKDAILLPPGSKPVFGLTGIKSYWFPNDGSVTRITGFDRKIEEIEGTRKLAFLRSTASLSWTYEKDGKKTAQTSRSIDLRLVTRDAAGRWHVIRQMWTALPN